MHQIKILLIKLLHWALRFDTVTRRQLSFFFGMIGWILLLFIATPFLVFVFNLLWPNNTVTDNDLILLITAAFILAYTYQTQKLKEITVLQNKMKSACDIEFSMATEYLKHSKNDLNGRYGVFRVNDLSSNTISKILFVSPFLHKPLGNCTRFYEDGSHSGRFADCRLDTEQERKSFLEILQLQGGEIKASVLTTNGEQFMYTFMAITDNWKEALKGGENLRDDFILIKKEIWF